MGKAQHLGRTAALAPTFGVTGWIESPTPEVAPLASAP
jgi:hypothetical protein